MRGIHAQGVRYVRPAVQVVHVTACGFRLHAPFMQVPRPSRGSVRRWPWPAARRWGRVTTSWARILPTRYCGRYRQGLDLGLLQLADVARGDAPAFLDDWSCLLILMSNAAVSPRRRSGIRSSLISSLLRWNGVGLEEHVQDLLVVVTERAQQDRSPATCGGGRCARTRRPWDRTRSRARSRGRGSRARRTGACPRNGSCPCHGRRTRPGERCNCETITRSVPLIDEGAVLGHERQFAHVDFLLLHFLGAAVLHRRFLVIQCQAHQHAQRRGDR